MCRATLTGVLQPRLLAPRVPSDGALPVLDVSDDRGLRHIPGQPLVHDGRYLQAVRQRHVHRVSGRSSFRLLGFGSNGNPARAASAP
jgi:hypothetical protein